MPGIGLTFGRWVCRVGKDVPFSVGNIKYVDRRRITDAYDGSAFSIGLSSAGT
jgi:hypothetical protein